jgi:Zn finger protein HypA/HybF involved in hydrogenase expression
MENISKNRIVVVPCLACGEPLFKMGPMDAEGYHWGRSGKDNPELQFDGVDHYYECPHCKACNVLISAGTGLRVSHVKKSG